MDPNNQNQPTAAPVTTPEHKKIGPIIAILTIVLVLIIAALYLFAASLNKPPIDADMGTPASMTTEVQSVAPVTNTSDDVTSIEADLNASTDGLDSSNF